MRTRHIPTVSRTTWIRPVLFGLGSAIIGGCVATSALVARRMVSPGVVPSAPITVLNVEEGAPGQPAVVRLSAGPDADLPGEHYSFLFDEVSPAVSAGHARLGAVQRARAFRSSTDPGWVERELIGVDRGVLLAGSRGRISGWWFADVATFGMVAEPIKLALRGGPADAWVIPAVDDRFDSRHWAIHVHGRGARPEETLRGVRVAGESDRVSLVISYRGDAGAPHALHGRYGFGAAEWQDVDAAMSEAVRRGATSISLFGWSMGATACLVAAERSPHAGLIDALVLDSPAVDWRRLTVHHAKLAGVPAVFGWLGGLLLESGLVRSGVAGGIPLRTLNPRAFAAHLSVPTLIHCGPGDTFVPEQAALKLASLRPDLVTVHRVWGGEHVRLWNVDPERWDDVTRAFLARF